MQLTVDGKFFRRADAYYFLKIVTYGPFPTETPHRPELDFPKIAKSGFNAVRTYSLPDQAMLDQAAQSDLLLIPTLPWAHGCDFIAEPEIFDSALSTMKNWLLLHRDHPGLGALLVGNEIPSDMARWMGPDLVRAALDQLILAAKEISPHLPVGYASFPTTEYLEPDYADFTAFNLYLEDPEKLDHYLPRLHHIAGDRPALLTEFGLDTQRNTEEQQKELIPKALNQAHLAGLAGFTAYAWSDHWFNNGETVTDWSFGLLRRDLSEKPALPVLKKALHGIQHPPHLENPPKISLIICTRNGAKRLTSCLNAAKEIAYPNFEILIINDGSTDGTQSLIEETKGITAYHLPPSGLSAARNYGASKAQGEIFAFTDDDCQADRDWLTWLAYTFTTTSHAAIGGPNLPPPTDSALIAITATAPGAPTHVMLSDTEAEHLPGCNIAIRKSAFEKIGGFDPIFHTAGDDVDVCWRLRDEGYTLGFSGAAFVWHDRRPTPWRYLRQQMGYGHAEALLYQKHPDRFTRGGRGGIRWEGCVYTGGALGIHHGDIIYSGDAGEAPYQSLIPRTQPMRPLPHKFNTARHSLFLRSLSWLQYHLRPWARHRHGGPPRLISRPEEKEADFHVNQTHTLIHHHGSGRDALYQYLRQHRWHPSSSPHYDLCKHGSHLIAATEQTGSKSARTFLRLHVPPGVVNPFQELCQHAEALGFETLARS